MEKPTLNVADLRQRDVEAFYRERRAITVGLTDVTPDEFGERVVGFVASLNEAVKDMPADRLRVVVREFSDGLLMMKRRGTVLSGPEENGVTVRTMARLGWLEGCSEEDVDGLKPAYVTELCSEFDAVIDEAYTVPKN